MLTTCWPVQDVRRHVHDCVATSRLASLSKQALQVLYPNASQQETTLEQLFESTALAGQKVDLDGEE